MYNILLVVWILTAHLSANLYSGWFTYSLSHSLVNFFGSCASAGCKTYNPHLSSLIVFLFYLSIQPTNSLLLYLLLCIWALLADACVGSGISARTLSPARLSHCTTSVSSSYLLLHSCCSSSRLAPATPPSTPSRSGAAAPRLHHLPPPQQHRR